MAKESEEFVTYGPGIYITLKEDSLNGTLEPIKQLPKKLLINATEVIAQKRDFDFNPVGVPEMEMVKIIAGEVQLEWKKRYANDDGIKSLEASHLKRIRQFASPFGPSETKESPAPRPGKTEPPPKHMPPKKEEPVKKAPAKQKEPVKTAAKVKRPTQKEKQEAAIVEARSKAVKTKKAAAVKKPTRKTLPEKQPKVDLKTKKVAAKVEKELDRTRRKSISGKAQNKSRERVPLPPIPAKNRKFIGTEALPKAHFVDSPAVFIKKRLIAKKGLKDSEQFEAFLVELAEKYKATRPVVNWRFMVYQYRSQLYLTGELEKVHNQGRPRYYREAAKA